MNNWKRKTLLFLVLSNALFVLMANERITNADLPYLCDFEDEELMTAWTLNPGENNLQLGNTNRWTVGDYLSYTGSRSLYVSNDTGKHNSYSPYNNVILALCSIKLSAGSYDITYDWYGYGNGQNGYLKIVNQIDNAECMSDNAEPKWVSNGLQLMGNMSMITSGDTALGWHHVSCSFISRGGIMENNGSKIFFVWVNSDAKILPVNNSIAIDNFQITKTSPTDYPSDLHLLSASWNNVTLSWLGTADSFEIMYKKKTDSEFTFVTSNTNTLTLKNIEYGVYEFWIRSVINGERTKYIIFPSIVLYETDCIDALNMYGATFETGNWGTSGKTNISYERVDFGYKNEKSRHTIHFDTTEYDVRTITLDKNGNMISGLKTIPEDHIASVRLGNWLTGSQYESIIYNYTVESRTRGVLLINYAQVLQDVDHLAKDQPQFTIDVLDEDGKSVDQTCGHISFHTPSKEERNDSAAYEEIKKTWNKADNAWWQDWHTIGINLEDYAGQTLSIPMTSYDCDQGGHYGYIYFTLGCARSDVDGLAWGQGNTTDHLTAPRGFLYAWFDRKDTAFKDTLTTNRNLPIEPNDTNTYICVLTYKTLPECQFSLEASAKSYVPRAEIKTTWAPKNCSNGFVVYNRCHVGLKNQLTGDIEERYDKKLDICHITYVNKNGDTTFLNMDYPEEGYFIPIDDEGDSIRFFEIVGGTEYNGIWYGDTTEHLFVVPATGPIETHIYDSICIGDNVEFPSESHVFRTQTGDYYDSLTSSVTGCDSTVIFHLLVHDLKSEIFDTVCINEKYNFNGKELLESGVYYDLQKSVSTGCDSFITLHLTHLMPPNFFIDSGLIVCNSVPLHINAENIWAIDSLNLRMNNGFDTTLYYPSENIDLTIQTQQLTIADKYTLLLTAYTRFCNILVDTMTFKVNLPPTATYTFFEDVIALSDENHNGGFKYTAYQWYKDGLPIPGATRSWYYNIDLDQTAEYTVLVTLEDGQQLWVCPIDFKDRRFLQTSIVSPQSQNAEVPRKIYQEGHIYILKNKIRTNLLGNQIY